MVNQSQDGTKPVSTSCYLVWANNIWALRETPQAEGETEWVVEWETDNNSCMRILFAILKVVFYKCNKKGRVFHMRQILSRY